MASGGEGIRGTVTAKVFLGEVIDYLVNVNGHELRVRHRARGEYDHHVGASVILTNCPSCVQGLGRNEPQGFAPKHLAVALAVQRGAKVVTPPTDVPNAGRHAVLTDPQGATFAVHSSAMPASPDRAPERGEFSWHELASSVDPLEVFPLYAELFDWEEMQRHDMGPIGTYLIFGRNGRQLGGMFNKGGMGQPGPAYWVCYVSVPDLTLTLGQLEQGRGSLLHGPAVVPGGDRIAQVRDPHGAFFALHWSAHLPAETP